MILALPFAVSSPTLLDEAKLLLEEDGSVREIRRAETLDDYFATLDFASL